MALEAAHPLSHMRHDVEPPSWPSWLEAQALDEAAWAEAWEATDEPLRARLKTCLAGLCEFYAPAAPPGLRSSLTERCGLRLTLDQAPRPLAVCFFPPQASPAQVSALCAPARLLGVDRVLAVCLGRIAPGVLCGLELAGVEEVFELSPDRTGDQAGGQAEDQAAELAAWAAEAGGVCLGLGDVPSGLHWRAPLPEAVQVWLEESGDFDLSAVVQAAGPARVLVWNSPDEPPRPCEAASGGFGDLLASGPEVLYAPEHRAAPLARLRLGPGREGDWLWPDLAASLFLIRRAGLFSALEADPGDPS